MKKEHKEDVEQIIERLYWEFDNERSKKIKTERDVFKSKMRTLAGELGAEEYQNG